MERRLRSRDFLLQRLYDQTEQLRMQIEGLNQELALSQSQIERMHAQRLDLINQIDQVKRDRSDIVEDLTRLQSERSRLMEELNQAQREIHDIRHSFLFGVARRVDRLFPDGTSRGEFRKIVVASLGVVSQEGARSFSRRVLEKIRRREFTIIEPLHRRLYDSHPPAAAPAPTYARSTELRDENLSQQLKKFLSARRARLRFPAHEAPVVTIVIVTYGNAHYTYQCLRSLLLDSIPPYEVVLVDNASSDETSSLLDRLDNVVVFRNNMNEFFVKGCNQGARNARGKYILFLNSDLFVNHGCVSWLAKAMDSDSSVGAAGAKLVWRDGGLQEAGSIVWRDGSALGYGRGDDPSKPEYGYTRDVDYCSAACLMVRRDAFEQLGGFDESFTPAYYEDSDFCMRLWGAGFRVVYQPLAVGSHVEFGASSFERATQLMEKHRLVFVAKHQKALQTKLPFSERNVIRARDRRPGPTVLVLDDCVPKPEEGSGYPRMFLLLRSLASLGYRVTLLPMTDATAKQPETGILNQMGVEVLWGGIGISELLRLRSDSYDIVLISRPHNALFAMDLVRETNPQATVIYDAEALWYPREQVRRRLGLPPTDPRFESEEAELSIMRSADYIMSVSVTEKHMIEEELGQKGKVTLWGHPHAVNPTLTPFAKRRDLLFVGGFKSAPSHNDDAATHFTEAMFPKVRDRLADCKFIVAGSNPPESVKRLAQHSVTVTGYVKDLTELYEKCRVFIAPMRFGGGIMWKVTEAMSRGLPCVLSKAAAQGLAIRDNDEALVASDDKDFIEKTVQLYEDEGLWNRIRKRELEYITENCDPARLKDMLGDFLKRVSGSSKCDSPTGKAEIEDK